MSGIEVRSGEEGKGREWKIRGRMTDVRYVLHTLAID